MNTFKFRYYLKKYALPVFYFIWMIVYSFIGGAKIVGPNKLVAPVDFLATYTAVQIIKDGQSEFLYNFKVQKAVQTPLNHVVVPPDNLLPFIHPPFFALPFLPLAYLSYNLAYLIVVVVNIILLGVVLYLLGQHFPGLSSISKLTLILGTYSFFPHIVNVMQSQNATLTLLLFTAAFITLKQEQEIKAGVLLSLTLYKPQLSLLVVLYLLIKGCWRSLFGFGTGALILVGISYIMVGQQGFIDYTNLTVLNSPLVDGAYGINYVGMHNWRSLFRLLLGPVASNQILTLSNWATLITLGLLFSSWGGKWQPKSARFDLTYASILLATLLISPHLNSHDLTVWILIGVLIINYLGLYYPATIKQPFTFGFIIVAGFVPLITFVLGPYIHLQLTPVFMALVLAGLVYYLHHFPVKDDTLLQESI